MSEKLDVMSPANNGSSHCFFCSAVPPIASSSLLPESGAWLPKISDATVTRPRISCISASLIWPYPWPPSSRSR